MKHHLSVPDITCAHCAEVVTKAVKSVDQSANPEVDVEGRHVKFMSPLPPTDFIEALEEVGYASFLAQV